MFNYKDHMKHYGININLLFHILFLVITMFEIIKLRENKFEVYDTKFRKMRKGNLMRKKADILGVIFLLLSIIYIIYASTDFLDGLVFFILLIISGPPLIFLDRKSVNKALKDNVASIILEYDNKKKLINFKIRIWRENKFEEYIEKEIRYNQAIGFQFVWFDNGKINIEIMVDFDYEGTLIFQTFDFNLLADFQKFIEIAIPKMNKFNYKLEDGENWDNESINELLELKNETRAHWIIKDYFRI